MVRALRRVLVLAAIVALIVLLRATVFATDPVPVTVYVVGRGRVEETVTNSKAGTVRALRRAKVSPDIGGRVATLYVRKGDRVRAGQEILRLDDTELRARAGSAERSLSSGRELEREACLSAEIAGRDFDRTAALARDRLVPEQALDQAGNRRDAANAACESARARTGELSSLLEVARSALSKTLLRAPFDGVVAELTTERGEWISPSPPGLPMPAVLDLIDTGSIYVSAPLDEVDRGKVTLDLPVRVTMDAFPGRSFPAHLTRIAPYVQDVAEQSRTFEVEATLEDQAFARSLPPGASADVEVILTARDGVPRIPSYALLEGRRVLVLAPACAGESFGARLAGIFSARGDGCLVSRDVQPGLKNWEFAEVKGGLEEGEKVVVSLDRAEVKEGVRARQSAVTER